MILALYRKQSTPACTHGDLYVNGIHFCYTLEDVVREEKIPGETAIPAGEYEVVLTESARVKNGTLWSPDEEKHLLPLLKDVPNFDGIRIHAGNTDRDTKGCILVGLKRGDDALLDSRKALSDLMLKLKSAAASEDKVTIIVEDAL